jgi:hypothetical protein
MLPVLPVVVFVKESSSDGLEKALVPLPALELEETDSRYRTWVEVGTHEAERRPCDAFPERSEGGPREAERRVTRRSGTGPREDDTRGSARSGAGPQEPERVVPSRPSPGSREADRVVLTRGWAGRPCGSSGECMAGVGLGSGGRPVGTDCGSGEWLPRLGTRSKGGPAEADFEDARGRDKVSLCGRIGLSPMPTSAISLTKFSEAGL